MPAIGPDKEFGNGRVERLEAQAMENLLIDFSARGLVKKAIKTNFENYHYCLGRSPSVELSIGRYLTWFVTNMPDHFMNLVVCTDLPEAGIHELIGSALDHFRSLK